MSTELDERRTNLDRVKRLEGAASVCLEEGEARLHRAQAAGEPSFEGFTLVRAAETLLAEAELETALWRDLPDPGSSRP